LGFDSTKIGKYYKINYLYTDKRTSLGNMCIPVMIIHHGFFYVYIKKTASGNGYGHKKRNTMKD